MSPAIPVLMYHSVSTVASGPLRSLAVPPRRLAEQLGALASAGYRLVGLTEATDLLASERSSAEPSHRLASVAEGSDAADFAATGTAARLAVLTFDDGYADFLHAGLPVLAEVGASATLYPAVGHLGGPAGWLGRWAGAFGPLLTVEQLREVAGAGIGIEIGNHGLRHHPLDVLPARQLHEELTTSHDRLEQALQRPVRSFCYPHGYHTRAVREAVALAGHENACEIGRRLFRPGDDRLAIPRLHPTPDHTGPELVALARTGGGRLVPAAKRLAQPGWRAVRRVARRFGRRLT